MFSFLFLFLLLSSSFNCFLWFSPKFGYSILRIPDFWAIMYMSNWVISFETTTSSSAIRSEKCWKMACAVPATDLRHLEVMPCAFSYTRVCYVCNKWLILLHSIHWKCNLDTESMLPILPHRIHCSFYLVDYFREREWGEEWGEEQKEREGGNLKQTPCW